MAIRYINELEKADLQSLTGTSIIYNEDLKIRFYQSVLGTAENNANDLEISYLQYRTGLTTRNLSTLWNAYCDIFSIPSGNILTRIAEFYANHDHNDFPNTSAITLNGSTERITVTNHASLDVGAQVTIAAWVNVTDDSTRQSILSNLNGDGKSGCQLAIESNDKARFWIGTTAGSNLYTTATVTLGSWIHVVGAYDGAKMRIYVNGVLASAEQAVTGTINTPVTDLFIGDWPSSAGAEFSGSLDQVRLWSKGLTALEILNLYRFDKVPQSASLVGEWLLDEGTGTAATDTSANSNNGLITGGTWITSGLPGS